GNALDVRDQPEGDERVAELAARDELGRVGPRSLDLLDPGTRSRSLDRLVQLAALVRSLVPDGRVGAAPVQAERERQVGELVDIAQRAALVPERLFPRDLVQELAD